MSTEPLDNMAHRSGVAPGSAVYTRLQALGKSAQKQNHFNAFFGVGSGVVVVSAVLMLLFIPPWELLGVKPPSGVALSSYSLVRGEVFGYVAFFGALIGSLSGYLALRVLLSQRYEKSYLRYFRELEDGALPAMVAEGDRVLQLQAQLRERGLRWPFIELAGANRLEDQLQLASAYLSELLRISSEGDVPYTVRAAPSFSSATGPYTLVLNALTSFGCVLPGFGWLTCLLVPFQLRNLLREAEQQAALAAICDYFCDTPQRHLRA